MQYPDWKCLCPAFWSGESQKRLCFCKRWRRSRRKAAESQGRTGQTTHAGSELNRLLLTWEPKSISGAVSVVTEGLAMEKVEEIKLRVFFLLTAY